MRTATHVAKSGTSWPKALGAFTAALLRLLPEAGFFQVCLTRETAQNSMLPLVDAPSPIRREAPRASSGQRPPKRTYDTKRLLPRLKSGVAGAEKTFIEGMKYIATGRLTGASRSVFSIARAVLCEIFDEAAYARYLKREGIGGSCETYQSFLREQEQRTNKPTRCC